jgi:prepilin-type N-terminal cleavage/methylation domain-containing protein
MAHRKGFTLIEMLVVISIIALLASLLYPAIRIVIIQTKIASTKALMGVLETALQQYASDHSGFYPPADCEDLSAQFNGQEPVDNSSHALCIFITGELISDEGRKAGSYTEIRPRNLLNKGNTTGTITINGYHLVYTDDYVIDAFGTPLVYDERKSENDTNGLNRNNCVLISGSARNKNTGVNLSDIEAGDITMFANNVKIECDRFDTRKADYENSIPEKNGTNDDLFSGLD